MNQHCKAKSCTAAALPSSGLCYTHTEALRDPAWPQPTGHFGVEVTEAINAKIRQEFNEAATATFTPPKADTTPLSTQVGGDHYKKLAIQPVEYIHKNGVGFMEGNVIKYVTRWRDKNGIKDLEKAKHYIDLLIELERVK